MISTPWIKADAWFRRDVGEAALTVSRTAGGTWAWRLGAGGVVLASGDGFGGSRSAMNAADGHMATTYGPVAA